ncbi:uncharacterized protein [Eurosta solidaginis]|uniref:uncharacterized protein n=1 Tax=Eurosta solidaginis TaxID=178769 RepID=UPI0035311FAC
MALFMDKSPRRSTRLNPVSGKHKRTAMPLMEKDMPMSNTTLSMPATKPASPIITSGSSTTSAASQESVVSAMQQRIAVLESNLRVAQAKLRDHEAQNAANNGMGATSAAPQPPTTQLPSAHPTGTQEITATTANTPPFPLRADIRYSPPLFTACSTTSTENCLYISLNNMYANPLPAVRATPLGFNPASTPAYTQMSSVAAPSSCLPRKMQALPDFCGKPEDWPIFYTAFTESTAVYGYSNFENNQRLQRSLKGEARESVKSLLIHPNNVSNIIEQLKFRFGRPEQLIRSQLARVKEIAPIAENAMVKIVPFASNVNNICAFLQSARGGDLHLANPTLLDELVMKLPISKRIEWASYAATVQSYATVKQFSEWLTNLASVICTVQDGDPVRDHKRRVVLHTAQTYRQSNCAICQGQHKTSECKQFIELTVANRWAQVKQSRLCFGCLSSGHGMRDCQRRKPCAIEGCRRMHHKLLHEVERPTTNLPKAVNSAKRHETSMVQAKNHTVMHTQPPVGSQQPKDAEAAVLSCSNGAESKLLFRILPVILYGINRSVETYALLDEGSSITMIDNTLLNELGLQGREQSLDFEMVRWSRSTGASPHC